MFVGERKNHTVRTQDPKSVEQPVFCHLYLTMSCREEMTETWWSAISVWAGVGSAPSVHDVFLLIADHCLNGLFAVAEWWLLNELVDWNCWNPRHRRRRRPIRCEPVANTLSFLVEEV